MARACPTWCESWKSWFHEVRTHAYCPRCGDVHLNDFVTGECEWDSDVSVYNGIEWYCPRCEHLFQYDSTALDLGPRGHNVCVPNFVETTHWWLAATLIGYPNLECECFGSFSLASVNPPIYRCDDCATKRTAVLVAVYCHECAGSVSLATEDPPIYRCNSCGTETGSLLKAIRLSAWAP
jgi:hypothetical protein